MHLLIAADHAGFELKEQLKKWLEANGHTHEDFGTHSTDSMDYPDVVHPLAKRVNLAPDTYKGILICGSGNGVCMTANKYPQVRAALVWNAELATLARQHNNANILCLPARFIVPEVAEACVKAFAETEFEGGRHLNRVKKIKP
jgi:ribose 5-phosphate isomerase B